MITRRIHVFGRVQGVFFRVSALEKAKELDIKGWVRNEPDRSVLIEASGQADKMNEFIKWCKKGPQSAEVERFQITELSILDFKQFEIVY